LISPSIVAITANDPNNDHGL